MCSFRTISSGINPSTPNEQSINRQKTGMLRTWPHIKASAITSRHAMIPKSTTQIFSTGSFRDLRKSIAIGLKGNHTSSESKPKTIKLLDPLRHNRDVGIHHFRWRTSTRINKKIFFNSQHLSYEDVPGLPEELPLGNKFALAGSTSLAHNDNHH